MSLSEGLVRITSGLRGTGVVVHRSDGHFVTLYLARAEDVAHAEGVADDAANTIEDYLMVHVGDKKEALRVPAVTVHPVVRNLYVAEREQCWARASRPGRWVVYGVRTLAPWG